MGRITFTAEEQHERIISEIEDEDDVDSQAEACRTAVERAEELTAEREEFEEEMQQLREEHEAELQRVCEEYEADLQEREAELQQAQHERDRLQDQIEQSRNERQNLVRLHQENEQLQEYVEDEVAFRRASLWKRMKWKVTGMPAGGED